MKFRFYVIFLFFCTSGVWTQSPTEMLTEDLRALKILLRDSLQSRPSALLERYDILFDWEEICRRTFAENWVNLTAGWQKRFREDVRQKLIADANSYLRDQIWLLDEKNSRWTGEDIGDNKAKVDLESVRSNEITVTHFRLTLTRDRWKIYDIRTSNFRLIRDYFGGLDEMMSAGYSNEYIEAILMKRASFIIDDFSTSDPDDYPRGWGWRKKDDALMRGRQRIYTRLKEEDNGYLHASATGGSAALVRSFSFNIKEFPILSWRWRARNLLSASDARVSSVTVIYYQNWIGVPVTVQYSWQNAARCSAITENGIFFDSHSIVLRNGADSLNTWIEENVNLVADYRRIFGEDPPDQTVGIFLLTNSASESEHAEADYDFFVAKRSSTNISCSK